MAALIMAVVLLAVAVVLFLAAFARPDGRLAFLAGAALAAGILVQPAAALL